jgi:hypothetical protein
VKVAAEDLKLKKAQLREDKKTEAERLKLQKVTDKEEKEAAKEAKKKSGFTVVEKPRPDSVKIRDVEYKVIELKSEWTITEMKILIDSVKELENQKQRFEVASRKYCRSLAAIYSRIQCKGIDQLL